MPHNLMIMTLRCSDITCRNLFVIALLSRLSLSLFLIEAFPTSFVSQPLLVNTLRQACPIFFFFFSAHPLFLYLTPRLSAQKAFLFLLFWSCVIFHYTFFISLIWVRSTWSDLSSSAKEKNPFLTDIIHFYLFVLHAFSRIIMSFHVVWCHILSYRTTPLFRVAKGQCQRFVYAAAAFALSLSLSWNTKVSK